MGIITTIVGSPSIFKTLIVKSAPYIVPGYEKVSDNLYRVWWTEFYADKYSFKTILFVQTVKSNSEESVEKYANAHIVKGINGIKLTKFRLMKIYNYSENNVLTVNFENYSSIEQRHVVFLNPVPNITVLNYTNGENLTLNVGGDLIVSRFALLKGGLNSIINMSSSNVREQYQELSNNTFVREWYPNIIIVNEMYEYSMYVLNERTHFFEKRVVDDKIYFDMSNIDYWLDGNKMVVVRKEFNAVVVKVG